MPVNPVTLPPQAAWPTSVPTTAVTSALGTNQINGTYSVNTINTANTVTTSAGHYAGISNAVSSVGSGYVFARTPQNELLTLKGTGNKDIVTIFADGRTEWGDGIDVDAAAEAFAKSMHIGGELASGITLKVKREMRDSVFNDIISIAKQKGSLTADDLTYLLEASKIMEKLKGNS